MGGGNFFLSWVQAAVVATGTSRVIVPAGQTTACYDADYHPYGGERVYTDTCPQNYKFTVQERDTETGNDYFGARTV